MTHAEPPIPPAVAAQTAPPAPKQRNTLGLIALGIAVIGVIFACIPGALIVGWILLPIAFILSIVSFFLKGAKWPSITALALSIVGTIIGFIVFFAVVATSFDEAFNNDTTVVETSQTPTTEDEAPAADNEAAAEEGTRENPYPLGTTVSSDEWEVTVNSVSFAANDAVAAENQFNSPPAPGNEYILINTTMTYTGDDPEGSMPVFVGIDYVTPTGETTELSIATAPDPLDSMTTLYNGGTVTGNIVAEVPSAGADTGVIAVRAGMLADTVFFAVK